MNLPIINIFLFTLYFIITQKMTIGVCIGTSPRTCLSNLEISEALDKLNYALGKYKAADLKIIGEPFEVHGQRITHGETEEFHIDFRYVDVKPLDLVQNCAFVIVTRPGECELIRTFCNVPLPNTPRPLMKQKTLVICKNDEGEDQVRVIDDEEDESETEANVTDMNEVEEEKNEEVDDQDDDEPKKSVEDPDAETINIE